MKRSPLALTVLCSAAAASAQQSGDIENIVVIAPMQTPISLATDPKAARQPLPAQDGADLLSSIAGFSLVKKGGANADPVFRGMSGSRINIIADNSQMLGGCGSRMDPPTAYITPQTYDNLKVIKGPQTVLHGPGNSAATVVFERNKEKLDRTEFTGFANSVLSSQGRHSLNADIKAGNQQGYARIAANYSDADDYKDGDGTAIHSAYRRWNADAEFAWTPDEDSVYAFTYGASDGKAAYADRMMDGSLFARQSMGVDIRLSSLAGLIDKLAFSAYYTDIDHIMDNHSVRPFVATMMMRSPTSANPDRKTYGAKLALTSEPGNHRLSYGLDWQANRHRNRTSRRQYTAPVQAMPRQADIEFEQIGLFTEYEYRITDRAQWVMGLRADNWQAEDRRAAIRSMMGARPNPTAGQRRDETLWSGFARYQAQAARFSYFIGVGITERFPDYWELVGANRGSPSSISAFAVKPEKTAQMDLGIAYEFDALTVNLAVFYNQVDDYLLIDNRFEKMGRQARVTRNIDAEGFGFEVELSWQVSAALTLRSSLDYVRGTNRSDATPLAQQPPLQARFSGSYRLTPKWQLGGLLRLVRKQHRIAPDQGNIAGQDVGETPGFGTFALNSTYEYSDELQLNLGIDNLFDKTYAEHLSRAGAAVSGYEQVTRINEPGRSLWLNINWLF